MTLQVCIFKSIMEQLMNRFLFLLPTGINPELLVSILFGEEPTTIPVGLAFLPSQWKEEFSTSPGRFLLLAYVILFWFLFFSPVGRNYVSHVSNEVTCCIQSLNIFQ